MSTHSNLKRWRIEMAKCLLEVEAIEDIRGQAVKELPDSIKSRIENLGRDFIIMQGRTP